MCVQNNHLYNTCSHIVYGSKQDCNRKICRGLEEYNFKKEGNCPHCRKHGSIVTRDPSSISTGYGPTSQLGLPPAEQEDIERQEKFDEVWENHQASRKALFLQSAATNEDTFSERSGRSSSWTHEPDSRQSGHGSSQTYSQTYEADSRRSGHGSNQTYSQTYEPDSRRSGHDSQTYKTHNEILRREDQGVEVIRTRHKERITCDSSKETTLYKKSGKNQY